MKPKIKRFTILISIALLFTACYKEEAGPNYTAPPASTLCAGLGNDQILPIAHGYKWTYRGLNYVSSGATLEFDTTSYFDPPVRRNGIVYIYHKSATMGRLFGVDYFGYDSLGNLRQTYNDSQYADGEDEILIPRDLYEGKAWRLRKWRSGSLTISHDSVRVGAMDASIETEECTYHNLIKLDLYSTGDHFLEETYYFKRGLGIVRFMDHDADWYMEDHELSKVKFD